MWSSPCRRDGEVEKSAPEGGYILSLRARERLGERCGAFFNGKAMPVSAMKTRFQIAECSSLYQLRRTG